MKSLPFSLTMPRSIQLILIGLMMSMLGALWRMWAEQPRVHAIPEVPIAFWAWRTQAPDPADLRQAFTETGPKILFLRAGQIEATNGRLERTRALRGPLPQGVALHLVYNGTRNIYRDFETIPTETLAAIILKTFTEDLGQSEHADVAGLQLDLDVPTRLLTQYAKVLKEIHRALPASIKLSITGLPTWTGTRDLNAVLEAIDFWIPQCYGLDIPERLTNEIPISSPDQVAQLMKKIRQFKKPYYAGLAAYGYAISYTREGALIEMRGDLDVTEASHQSQLELITNEMPQRETSEGEELILYRAKSDLVIDGLILRTGEWLLFDVPSAETLRQNARAVRAEAGDQLVGMCIFRLPSAADKTVLSAAEIRAALADRETTIATTLTINHDGRHAVELIAANTGTARAKIRPDAFVVDLSVPVGQVRQIISLKGFTGYETLSSQGGEVSPCSEHRANLFRFRASVWKPGDRAMIRLEMNDASMVSAKMTTHVNDGRIVSEEKILQSGGE